MYHGADQGAAVLADAEIIEADGNRTAVGDVHPGGIGEAGAGDIQFEHDVFRGFGQPVVEKLTGTCTKDWAEGMVA